MSDKNKAKCNTNYYIMNGTMMRSESTQESEFRVQKIKMVTQSNYLESCNICIIILFSQKKF